MRKRGPPRVERMRLGVVEEVTHARHVDVREATETRCEVGVVVMRPKDTPKLLVEQRLCC